MNQKNDLMEKIVSLAKRRGFVFPGSEIYGGLANSYDFGPLGVELFRNIKNLWWKYFVQMRPDVVGIEGPIIMNPKVWEASGHITNFTDPLVECKICHVRIRQDKPVDIKSHEETHKGKKVEWTDPKNFNLLFKTFIGAVEDEKSIVYLRGETAQTMVTDFKMVQETTRNKLPFGVAQIGKSFRNEITTGNFLFRLKEFTIAELEYFVKPGEDEAAFEDWLKYEENFFVSGLGLDKKNIKPTDLPKGELAHYSKRTVDWYYNFPFGWDEFAAVANRTDYDLKNHIKHSGKDLSYKDPNTGEQFVPYIIEPTFGVERMMMAVLIDSYLEDKDRVVLKLPAKLAPYKAAVFPLLKNKPELVAKAWAIYEDLLQRFPTAWDDRGNVGKRYYAQDEIGTPYAITVDFQTLEDDTVTIRDLNTTKQERIKTSELSAHIFSKLNG